MSEQLEPGQELDDEETIEGTAPTDDPHAQEGEQSEADEDGDNEGDEPEVPEVKLSRFQRFKQEQEELVQEKERELKYWREVAMKQAPVEPAQRVEEDNEPQLSDFEGQGIDAYLQAHSKWTQKTMIAQARQEAAEAYRRERENELLQAKVKEARKELKDWDEVMARSRIPAMHDTAEFLLSSDVGPKMAYHLAKNPSEHERLNSLPPVRRIAELGKLEDRLSGATAAPVTKVTKAPGKLSSVKGSAVLTTDTAVAAREGYAAWKAARSAKK